MPNIVFSEVTYGFAIVGGSTILGHHVQHSLPLPLPMGRGAYGVGARGLTVFMLCVAGITSSLGLLRSAS